MTIDTKRQDLPKGLWVVATPIGNRSDLSDRCRWALTEAELILCEDTRRTMQLLSSLGIPRPREGLDRLDAHTSEKLFNNWIIKIQTGVRVALVTDAGTPAISDPGADFVAAVREAGVAVTPLPGPSAVTALLSVCGFRGEAAFTFRGFFPRKTSDRKQEIKKVMAASVSSVFVWFESPERVEDSLADIAEQLGDRGNIVAAKELTKIHERYFAGTPREVGEAVREEIAREGARGEWCFALRCDASSNEDADSAAKTEGWRLALECLLEAGVPASDASRRVSQKFGIAKGEAYRQSLVISGAFSAKK